MVLLQLLEQHEPLVEATLRRYGVRYTDRWRRDPDGARRLTLREIWNLLRVLRDDDPLVVKLNDGQPRLTATDYLLMDVYEAITRSRHPRRPLTAEDRAKLAEAAAKKAAREAKAKNLFAENRRRRNGEVVT